MSIQTIPTLRKATTEDLEDLVRLRLDFLRETRKVKDEAIFSALEGECRRYFLAKIADESYHSWVAEAEGEIVACGGLIFIEKPPSPRHFSGKEALILNMYTTPTWRKHGLATRILQDILAFIKTTNAHRICLYATQDGQPVYEKLGFVIKHNHVPEMELIWE
ncbi:hypothetical protein KSC_085380 [Ktedonobacter sp. SOSP1-52]|uniref:GNAT family N-acetyltransferase n=1 Tax=Ktedonobacter sp. SOSP1-52 TaxID=2778366 RepID=UPI001916C02F|nr:GNAT family N-acetyltransferase [Ktedonobacter sp. SOSP1-52]GHO69646.1 hypothetical protein KSC_085380 [Ktedonobacter sp. SOSP1-52]